MSGDRGTLEELIGQLTILFSPLTGLTSAEAPKFLAELGLPLTDAQANVIAPVLKKTTGAAGGLIDIALQLQAAIEAGQLDAVIEIGVEAGDRVVKLISGFDQLKVALGGLGLPNAGSIIATLPERLFNLLLARFFGRTEGLNEALQFAGILERTDHNVGLIDPLKPFFTTNEFHFGRFGGWLTDPAGQLGDLYDWGKGSFDGKKILALLDRLAAEAGLPSLYDPSAPSPSLDLVVFELLPRTNLNPRGIAVRLRQPLVKGSVELDRQRWSSTFGLETNLPTDTEIVLQPGKITVSPPDATSVSGKASATYSYLRDPDDPLLLLSIAGGTRVSVEEVAASIVLNMLPNGQASLGLGADLKRGKVLITTGEADGFIAKILSGFEVESNFDLGASFSMAEGLHFHGSSTLEIQLASHISLGPVEIQALTLLIGIEGNEFPVGVAVDLKAVLGPLVAIVQGIGIEVAIALAEDNKGNVGPIDLRPRFLPPKGIGLSLDAGIVKGGGYLYFDPDKEEYAGALELAFAGIVTIKAIGLLTTRMPDGSKGFSLLIIMSVEFGTGIQLGFGFTLLAVGGLLGLNRTMNLQALMEGVRSGAIESIMFPDDVIANAPKIISDLRIVFPPQEGTFLIGPMAKLGWGTPTLVSISLGIIIEIPGNIAILGILKIAIPADEIALIVLQVNFAGAIEFDKKRMYFFAALFESRVIFLTLEGEMGLLVAFGDDANFVVSVGGFHPRFSPPPLPFPSPIRIAINILNESWAKLRVEGYFAVTSNSVQFGARVELFFGLDELNVKGHLAFDALFQFSPFFFSIEISASLSVNVFGAGLFSVSIGGLLEGPAPWHVKGHGSISVLFIEVDVEFETTWGESRDTNLPPIAVMPLLEGELAKAETWRALPPASSNLLVSLRKMTEEEAALILHPLGVLHVSQRGLPLEIKLDKVGTQKPSDANRLSIGVAGGLAKKNDTFEQFAPAQFQSFSDAD
jgi:hypothetical protein